MKSFADWQKQQAGTELGIDWSQAATPEGQLRINQQLDEIRLDEKAREAGPAGSESYHTVQQQEALRRGDKPMAEFYGSQAEQARKKLADIAKRAAEREEQAEEQKRYGKAQERKNTAETLAADKFAHAKSEDTLARKDAIKKANRAIRGKQLDRKATAALNQIKLKLGRTDSQIAKTEKRIAALVKSLAAAEADLDKKKWDARQDNSDLEKKGKPVLRDLEAKIRQIRSDRAGAERQLEQFQADAAEQKADVLKAMGDAPSTHEGKTATNPGTGEKMVVRNGKLVPLEGK